uniref:LAGLIDADG_2 domain-containing protein n=1 Tax=Heterorhabditis bacteriophora TaxID=37862 RepID=A0A1I7W9C0_HETBA
MPHNTIKIFKIYLTWHCKNKYSLEHKTKSMKKRCGFVISINRHDNFVIYTHNLSTNYSNKRTVSYKCYFLECFSAKEVASIYTKYKIILF